MVAPSVRRVVIAHRPTEWDLLLERHATPGQVRFFLETRDQDVEIVKRRHRLQQEAMAAVERAIPTTWRRARVPRASFPDFLFQPDDIVVAVGQDGLIPNLAKYLDGQPVIGVNSDPERFEGRLVGAAVEHVADLLADTGRQAAAVEERTMVEGRVDDGRTLVALNEIFVGHLSHQSARYVLDAAGRRERQSSSGLIVATGTGASGWARSIATERHSDLALPGPTERAVAFFVREAWPSIATGASLTEGLIDRAHRLTIVSEMEEGGVAFGDGIESDGLAVEWGQTVEIGVAGRTLRMVRP